MNFPRGGFRAICNKTGNLARDAHKKKCARIFEHFFRIVRPMSPGSTCIETKVVKANYNWLEKTKAALFARRFLPSLFFPPMRCWALT